MARLRNIQEFEKRKAAAPPSAISPTSQSVTEGFQQMAEFNPQKPTLEKVDPNKVYESTRSQALGSDAAQTDPQKTMESWNASPYEYWTEQAKANPGNAYAIVNQMMASSETPEEKAKREKRERLGEVFSNLGNLIGNAANLYYTHRGGQYIDLNTSNEKHRARMEAIKAKQDALKQRQDEMLMKYKVADIQAARDAAAKKEAQKREDAIRKENRAYQEQKDKQNQENWNKQFEFNAKQAEQAAAERAANKEYQRKQDELNNSFKWAQLQWQKDKANASSSNKGDKTKIAVVETPNGFMDVDFGKINQTTYNQLYKNVSDEIKGKYAIDSYDDEKARQEKMGKAISEAIMNQKGYSDWFVKSGVGVYKNKPSEEAPKTNWSDYLYKNTDWNQFKSNGGVAEPEKEENVAVKSDVSNVQPTYNTANANEQQGNKYERMVAKINERKNNEEEARKRTIEKAMAKTAKTVNDAKAKRTELLSILNNDYPEMDVEQFISDNNLGWSDAARVRMEYSNDAKERARILREIERLNVIINNR